MGERQFDRVTDLGDLLIETTDVGVRNVGNLWRQQIFHICAHHAFKSETGTQIAHDVVAGFQCTVAKWPRKVNDVVATVI